MPRGAPWHTSTVNPHSHTIQIAGLILPSLLSSLSSPTQFPTSSFVRGFVRKMGSSSSTALASVCQHCSCSPELIRTNQRNRPACTRCGGIQLVAANRSVLIYSFLSFFTAINHLFVFHSVKHLRRALQVCRHFSRTTVTTHR
jgi:hypothetical protein